MVTPPRDPDPTVTAPERLLIAIWQEVLDREDVGVRDDFFRLGGDSILIMQVVARARKLGIRLRARDFFTHTTISELAAIGSAAAPEPQPGANGADSADGPVPLTPMQAWFFAQQPREPDRFQQSVLVTIAEPVDQELLRSALFGLVERHDALRLRFWLGPDADWKQQATGAADLVSVPLDFIDLSGLGPYSAAVAVTEHAATAENTISLGQPPLLRAVQFDRGPEGAELLMVAHHLAVDTVSWQVLVEDLAELYDAAVRRERAQLASASSFAAWARRLSEHGLAPAPPAGRLAGPIRATTFRLSAPTTARLVTHDLGSVQEILLAGLAEALGVLGPAEHVVDVERHGRDHGFDDLDVLRTVGWFGCVSALTLPSSGSPGLLGTIRERLAASAGPGGQVPSAEITFNYLGRPVTAHSSGWSWRPRLALDPVGGRLPASPLEVVARIVDGELLVDLQYDIECFDDDLITRIASAYSASVENMASDRGRPDAVEPGLADVLELTPMQIGMLFPSLRGEGGGSYVEQRVWPVSPDEVDKYVGAWQRLYERHDALRTGFRWRGVPEPRQFFGPCGRVPVTEREFPGEEGFAEFLRADRAQGFDLERPPLARLTKVRVGPSDVRLVLTDHHILTDGWSYGLLCNELAVLLDGGRLELDPPSFRTYVEWLRSQPKEPALRFWRHRLAGAAPLRLTQPEPGSGYLEYLVRLDEGTSRALREAGSAGGLTLSSVAHGCWALALSAFTGQPDVVFATTYAVRPADLADVERIVGPMIATGPVRVRIDPRQLVADLLRGMQSQLAELMQQRPLSLSEIAAASGYGVTTGLCESAIAFENYPLPARFRGPAEGVNLIEGTVRSAVSQPDFPLTVIVRASDARIGLRFVYDSGLVADETARILAELLVCQFAEVAMGLGRPLGMLELTAPRTRTRVAAGSAGQDATAGANSVVELFETAAATTPGAFALAYDRGSLTYSELSERSGRLADHLHGLGVGAEHVVGVCLERGPDLAVAVLAVLRAGGAFLPLDPAVPAERLLEIAVDSGAMAVLTTSASGINWPPGLRVIDIERDRALIQAAACEPPRPGPASDDLAYVIYTSGSTGRQKGVQLQHGGLVNRLVWMAGECGLHSDDVILQKTAFGFDVAVWELLWAWVRGACLYVTEPGTERDAVKLASAIERSGATVVHFVPSALDAYLGSGSAASAGLRLVVCSGEPLRPALARAARTAFPNAVVYNLYGPTEATIDVTYWRVPEPVPATVPIGRPIAGHQLHVLDRTGRLVPDGVPGELVLAGPGLARGYTGRPGLTARQFVPNPFGPPGSRLYRTGDLVRRRTDGAVEYQGRIDRQVKIRGFRVECGEVEALLAALDEVGTVAVIAPADGQARRYLAAFVTPAPGLDARDLSAARLRAQLAACVPEYLVPAVLVPLTALPLTMSGKVDYAALAESAAPTRTSTSASTRTGLEARLSAIWRAVLDRADVGVEDDFFELGGHSLGAMRIAGLAGQEFGIEIPVSAAFDRPTVAAMAMFIADRIGENETRDVPAAREHTGPSPTSFAQQGVWLAAQAAPDSPFYNVPMAFWLRGSLNPRALARALENLVERQEALRTRFGSADGEPYQITEQSAAVGLSIEDVAGEDPQAQARRIIGEEALKPFDLGLAPLLRCRLLRLGAEDHILILVTHHIISDAWSKGIVAGDLWAFYRAAVLGGQPDLPDLPVCYRDFAIWQRERIEGAQGARQFSYWAEQMAGAPAYLEIPGARPPGAAVGHRGTRTELELSPAAAAGIAAACPSATPFMTVLAGFQALLAHATGARDLVVGTAVAGRSMPEVYGLVGMFANTLPIRTDCSGDPTFARLVERVRASAVGAYAHQELPLEHLVRALAPDRQSGRVPLVQVLIQENPPRWGMEVGVRIDGLHVTQLATAVPTTALDLVANLDTTAKGGLAIRAMARSIAILCRHR